MKIVGVDLHAKQLDTETGELIEKMPVETRAFTQVCAFSSPFPGILSAKRFIVK